MSIAQKYENIDNSNDKTRIYLEVEDSERDRRSNTK